MHNHSIYSSLTHLQIDSRIGAQENFNHKVCRLEERLLNNPCDTSLSENVDYIPEATQLVFPAGSGPLATEGDSLSPINDNRVENSETVPLSATVVSGGGSFTPDGDSATVAIQDDDSK